MLSITSVAQGGVQSDGRRSSVLEEVDGFGFAEGSDRHPMTRRIDLQKAPEVVDGKLGSYDGQNLVQKRTGSLAGHADREVLESYVVEVR